VPQIPLQQQDQEGQAALPAQIRQRAAEELGQFIAALT